MTLLVIAIGGAIGAVLRYSVSGLTYNYLGSGLPVGTIGVNLIGSFIVGLLFDPLQKLDAQTKQFVFIGLFGAFTTFSTFAIETINLIRDSEYVRAFLNIIISNLGALLLVAIGITTSKFVLNLAK